MTKYSESMRDAITETVRRRIHDAAIELIREHGWAAFTTERIAERAGVSRGVLYNYFDDKEAIARSIIEASFAEMLARLNEIADGAGSATERLSAMAEFSVRHFLAQREMHHTFIENLPPPGRNRRPPIDGRQQKHQLFIRVIAEGVAAGEFRPVDPDAAATLLGGGLQRLCREGLFSGNEADPRPLIEIFLYGLKP